MLSRGLLTFLSCLILLMLYSEYELAKIETIDFKKTIKINSPVTLLDRNAYKLNASYVNSYNYNDQNDLHEFSPLLIRAVLEAEDKDFYQHRGVDWFAKLRALWMNMLDFRFAQGGSTISEQVVRIVQPRKKRTLWSKWLEMLGAYRLEKKYKKDEILNFYLNQVPFSQNRRGFTQAAKLYFGRELETLSQREILTLVVMLRGPNRFDIRKNNLSQKRVDFLAQKLKINLSDVVIPDNETLLDDGSIYFNQYVKKQIKIDSKTIKTTLDHALQLNVQKKLEAMISKNNMYGAKHAALMITDFTTGEVLSYNIVNDAKDSIGFDTTLISRQVASTIKPFLYAHYFELGNEPNQLVDDSDFDLSFSGGIHQLKNYSRHHYGEVTLREALANSLNIPAVRLVQALGAERFYRLLEKLNLKLKQNILFLGEGMALGNMELSLQQMMYAYSCLANRGLCRTLKFTNHSSDESFRLFSPETADMVRDILSDPYARFKEFGYIDFNHQVAFKTGTSTDYRDSWAYVFNDQYLIGVWIGNLAAKGMDHITGSKIALKLAKSIIEMPRLAKQARPFILSKNLHRKSYCYKKSDHCFIKEDLFWSDKIKNQYKISESENVDFKIFPNQEFLHLAFDPRVQDHLQKYLFKTNDPKNTIWSIDGKNYPGHPTGLAFPIKKGEYLIQAKSLITGDKKSIKVFVH